MAPLPSFTLVAAPHPGARRWSYTCAPWSPYPQTRGASVKKAKDRNVYMVGVLEFAMCRLIRTERTARPSALYEKCLIAYPKGPKAKAALRWANAATGARSLATSAASSRLRRGAPHTSSLPRPFRGRAALLPASPGANTQPAGGWLIGSQLRFRVGRSDRSSRSRIATVAPSLCWRN